MSEAATEGEGGIRDGTPGDEGSEAGSEASSREAGSGEGRGARRVRRLVPRIGSVPRLVLLVFLMLTVGWWLVGRITADSRRLEIHRVDEAAMVESAAAESAAAESAIPESGNPESGSPGEPVEPGRPGVDASPGSDVDDSEPRRLRVLAWNIAHGRGDVGPGLFRNFRGGDEETRLLRLMRIAQVIRDVAPDVVVLNEVDFQSTWSGGVNQAEVLARATGFGVWVEQRNYDLQLPFGVLEFGNALFSHVPVDTAVWVDIPPHRWIEAVVVGAKAASMVRLGGRVGPLSVIPVHLEVRGTETRQGAASVFQEVGAREASPLILAGDFNSAPPGWPQTGDREGMTSVERTAVGSLLDAGWRSARVRGGPGPGQWTYPVPDADRAIDWVLVEPPVRVLEARVVEGTAGLSDHAPVLSVLAVPERGD